MPCCESARCKRLRASIAGSTPEAPLVVRPAIACAQSAAAGGAGERASQSASRFAYDAPIDAALEAAGSSASALDPLSASLGSLADPLTAHPSEAGSRTHSRGGSTAGAHGGGGGGAYAVSNDTNSNCCSPNPPTSEVDLCLSCPAH